MAHDVFISHSSKDKIVADAICAALEAEGIRCWIAPRDILTGESWAESITNALTASKIMVLLYSNHSNRSRQVANELTLAMDSEVVVVPFKMDDSSPGRVMRYYLSGTHWLDAMNPPTEKHISTLVKTVKMIMQGKEAELESLHNKEDLFTKGFPGKDEQHWSSKLSKGKKLIYAAALLGIAALMLYGGMQLFGKDAGLDRAANNYQHAGALDRSDGEVATLDDLANVIVVHSIEDRGEGSLYQAMVDAQHGDSIIFDPEVFPPAEPATIYLKSPLPIITRGGVTIDASNAGVILDGSELLFPFPVNIQSPGNVIMGLHIINIEEEAGILLHHSAQRNIIGGDPSVGEGPLGQGNLIGGCKIGIELMGQGVSNNLITGNIIGADYGGERSSLFSGNVEGIRISSGASNNTIGPNNIIAYNQIGVYVDDYYYNDYYRGEIEFASIRNTITANSIHNNRENGIYIQGEANSALSAPRINSYSLSAGIVRGTAVPGSTVEIFSGSGRQGRYYEGSVIAGADGSFIFEAGHSLQGPNITATATDRDGNTSGFR